MKRTLFVLAGATLAGAMVGAPTAPLPLADLCAQMNRTAILDELQKQLLNMTTFTDMFMNMGDVGMPGGITGVTGGIPGAPTDNPPDTGLGGGMIQLPNDDMNMTMPNFNMTDFTDFFNTGLQNLTNTFDLFQLCNFNTTDWANPVMGGGMGRIEELEDEALFTHMLTDSLRMDISINITDADSFIERIYTRINRLEERQADIADGLETIQQSLRQVGSLVLKTNRTSIYEHRNANFTFMSKLFKPDDALDTGRSRVKFPGLSLHNKTVSVIEWNRNPFEKKVARKLLSKVLSIQLADLLSGNETQIVNLPQEINITLYVQNANAAGNTPQCVYWDTSLDNWGTSGCAVRQVWGNWVTCGCTHLTDFAVTNSPSDGGTANKNLAVIIGGSVGGFIGFVLLASIAAGLFLLVNGRRRKPVLHTEYTQNTVYGHGTQV